MGAHPPSFVEESAGDEKLILNENPGTYIFLLSEGVYLCLEPTKMGRCIFFHRPNSGNYRGLFRCFPGKEFENIFR